MRIKTIKIEGLFDLFDYDISLESEENILILTGPNGYGKTTILNIIYCFFNKNLFYYNYLVFKAITFFMDNDYSMQIKKSNDNDVDFIFKNNFSETSSFYFSTEGFATWESILRKEHQIYYGGNDNWIDLKENKMYSTLDFFYQFHNDISKCLKVG